MLLANSRYPTQVAQNLPSPLTARAAPTRLDLSTLSLQEQDGDMWQAANWVQLLQPIVSFLSQVMQRFGCNTEEQLEEMHTSVASLQQTAQTFKQLERCPGDRNVINDLSNLAKYVRVLPCVINTRPAAVMGSLLITSIGPWQS